MRREMTLVSKIKGKNLFILSVNCQQVDGSSPMKEWQIRPRSRLGKCPTKGFPQLMIFSMTTSSVLGRLGFFCSKEISSTFSHNFSGDSFFTSFSNSSQSFLQTLISYSYLSMFFLGLSKLISHLFLKQSKMRFDLKSILALSSFLSICSMLAIVSLSSGLKKTVYNPYTLCSNGLQVPQFSYQLYKRRQSMPYLKAFEKSMPFLAKNAILSHSATMILLKPDLAAPETQKLQAFGQYSPS